jgi:predicted aldo/keto reductase-like oxidoreductase
MPLREGKMQYRRFGKLNWKCSALGFGAMRLPQVSQEMMSPIDESEAIKMIRYAIDNGVNYVDTAFPYGMGGSERVVGKALQDGYRQKVRLATKLSPFVLKSPDELDRYLDSQLKRLQTDKIDYYLLHGMNAHSWKQMKEWKAIQFVEKQIAQGKIGYLGFSFHDTYEVFKEIVDYYDNWTLCQVQYNYLDENNQAGRKGVEYAAAKGLAVVVMEPLRGGQLVKVQPAVAKEWEEPEKIRSRVEWSLDWVWNQEAVSLALSGMSSMEQTVQNVNFAARSEVGMLSITDSEVFKKVVRVFESLSPIPCTACKYCQPCPNGVNIPRIFELYNDKKVTDNYHARLYYATDMGMPVEQRANNCVECGECVKKCPQQIDIPEQLKKAHAELTQGGPAGPPHRRDISFEE